jgi:hypothetical protein
MINPDRHPLPSSSDAELLTDDEAEAIRQSEAWFNKNGGEGIPMEEVLADFGWSMKDFPLEEIEDRAGDASAGYRVD